MMNKMDRPTHPCEACQLPTVGRRKFCDQCFRIRFNARRARWQRLNPEKVKEWTMKWRKENKDRLVGRNRVYIREYMRAYRKKKRIASGVEPEIPRAV